MLFNNMCITLFSISCYLIFFSYLLFSFIISIDMGAECASLSRWCDKNKFLQSLNNHKCSVLQTGQVASSPLVPSVLISPEPTRQVEGAVGSQMGVHPLGEMKDLWWRERLPLAFFSLEPALAPAGRAFLSPPGNI